MPKREKATNCGAAMYAKEQYLRERRNWHLLIKAGVMDKEDNAWIKIQQREVLNAFHAFRILDKHWKNNL